MSRSMSHSTTTPAPVNTTTSRPRLAGRWLVSFLGFPIGGYASYLLIGPVDSLIPSLLGGLLTGAVLGSLQVWALGRSRTSATRWVIATALGLMVGLGVGELSVREQPSGEAGPAGAGVDGRRGSGGRARRRTRHGCSYRWGVVVGAVGLTGRPGWAAIHAARMFPGWSARWSRTSASRRSC